MFRNIGAPEIIIIAVLLVLVLGWKRLPDAARSLGRSMRIFKSEVSEMKQDGKSAASGDPVRGETLRDETLRDETLRDETRRDETRAGAPRTGPLRDTESPLRDGDAVREDNSPRTDNHTGPVS